MRVVVTGGAGFIGSHLVEELLRRGSAVVVVDDLSSGKQANLAGMKGALEFARHSITEIEPLQKVFQGADYVLHLAARTSVPRSVADPIETNRVNIDGTVNVLVAARDARVRRVVFAASSSAYGETAAQPKTEAMRPDPISPYGVTKFVGEIYCQVFGRCYGLESVALRYFNVFGPRQDPGSPYSGVLSRFITAMLEGQPPTVFGDGEQSRDFTYVSNVVDATLRAAEAPGVSGMVFNCGTGGRFTLNHTLALLSKISGKPANAKYEAARTGDIRDSQADISLARQMLGYVPSVDFEEGLRRTWDWYKSQPR
jgi:UDP-N-acetylglucosamine/UDP-N-acetyl-alpha-D-glucosaminouronate 4-epimerase